MFMVLRPFFKAHPRKWLSLGLGPSPFPVCPDPMQPSSQLVHFGSFCFVLCALFMYVYLLCHLFAIARSYRLQRLWCMAMFKTVLNGINVYTAFENHPFEVVFGEFHSI